MEQITKYIGLVAIVAMLTVVTVTGSIGGAEAISREGIRNDNVVLPEPEPEVDLILIQVTDPRQSHDVPVKTTKGEPTRYSDEVTYRVLYMVQNDGSTDVKNVMISVQSDTETVEEKLSGKLQPKHSTITVLVKAVDPSTIDAKIVGYET